MSGVGENISQDVLILGIDLSPVGEIVITFLTVAPLNELCSAVYPPSLDLA